MADTASPLMLRRRLRTELRIARLNRELTQEQVARAMEWSLSKMNRIEKAKSGISTNDLKELLRLYGIVDKERTEELLARARAARQSPWWSWYRDIAPAELLELIDFESAASAVSQFETIFVPGILQTAEYASAVLQAFHGEKSAAERVAALVDLYTRRSDLLVSENAPVFSFVLDESVIRRQIGSPAAMKRQFMRLVHVAELPNVTIQIVPFTAGLHPKMNGSFEVVQFDDTPDENIVFLEGPRGDSIIDDDPAETAEYLWAFRRIAQKALGPLESLVRLRQAADEMT
jgi:transcriptional regulator with XRE-family HTH domain